MNLLHDFKNKPFIEALQSFFKNLNVPFNVISEYQTKPENIIGDKKCNQNINAIYPLGIVTDAIFNQEQIRITQTDVANNKYEGILLFGVEVSKTNPTRSDLAEISRQINREFSQTPVVVVFSYADKLTFANAERIDYKQTWREGEKVGKVSMLKDINVEKPHRAHHDILSELGKHKANTFDDLYKYWQEKLNTKALNKKFFKKIANWYFLSVAHSKFPYEYLKKDTKLSTKTNDELQELANQKATIRFITRMIFVWFLKEKKLISDDLFEADKVSKILKNFNQDDSTDYYNAILQNLFFATLNKAKEHREFALKKSFHENKSNHDVNSLYRNENMFQDENPENIMKLFENIPFLNGGLFDSLDNKENKELIDGFSREEKWQAKMPDFLFFEKGELDFDSELRKIYDTKKEHYEVKGLFEIFNEYKFTIEENTPLETDVALDPYLLGEIFENLLAYYNPETGATARKGTGSFYTPQEIVNYMVDESLKAYLSPLSYEEEINILTNEEKYQIIKKLSDVKILDPACGSGAFPMGVLYKMVDMLKHIDPDNSIWKQIQHDKIIGDKITELEADKKAIAGLSDKQVKEKATKAVEDRLQELETIFNNEYNFDDYARKLYIIQNCIYGVDIQDVAIQISKLRFFLSLIVDQKNDDIKPLPNLETKFVIANTLIGIDLPKLTLMGEEDHSQDTTKKLKEELKIVRNNHFKASTRTEKLKLKAQDQAIRERIANSLADTVTIKNQYEIDELYKQIDKLKKDLIKANQLPEIQEVETGTLFETKKIIINPRKNKIAEINQSIKNCESKIASLQTNTQAELIRTQALKIAQWDIYNQNAQADWFDTEWMFGIQDGFDVVIGNPPYGALSSNSEKEYFKKNYLTTKSIKNVQKGSLDTYSLFIELGHKVLRKNGNLIYIIPMSINCSDSMTATQYLLESSCSKIKISSFSNRPKPIFENAFVKTSILFFVKDNKNANQILTTKMYRKNDILTIEQIISNFSFVDSLKYKLIGRYPKISTETEVLILKKLFSNQLNIEKVIQVNGGEVFYRAAGGRYYNVVTNYTTNSSAEKVIVVDESYSDFICAVLSSNLFWWYQQVYTDCLNLKLYEISQFPLPLIESEIFAKIKNLYDKYLLEIEANAKVRIAKTREKIESFKEYKIRKSKHLIDKIDDLIGPLYGLTKDEIKFIKNYEIEYRISDDE